MKKLIVITGPTGVGKTDIAIRLAKEYHAEIISADSRQIYRDIPIGTAMATKEQQREVPHHFVGIFNLDEYYSAAQFETDVMDLLPQLFEKSDYAVMCGGSMMYVDAVCKGIDDIPTINDDIRKKVQEIFETKGFDFLKAELQRLDPIYYEQVDLNNHKRVIHAVEICLQSGKKYSDLRKNEIKQRPFQIIKIGLNLPREQLFERINQRVLNMVKEGLIDEAKRFYPQRHLNSLNTVGYKELFAWMNGDMDYETAIARIQKNTRVYAKKQLTWYKKDTDIKWFEPTAYDEILSYIQTIAK